MVAEADGQSIAGLRMELPVGSTAPAGASLRTWVYVDEQTVGDASAFFGFSFDEEYPNSTAGWNNLIGWEVLSPTSSALQVGGSSLPLSFGLPGDGWHLVRVNYHRTDNSLRLWVDGELMADEIAPGIGGAAAHYGVLGALGEGGGARCVVRFDDSSLLPMLDSDWPAEAHHYARVEGAESTVEGGTYEYQIRWGNGYPVLGAEAVTETLPETTYVGLSIPDGYGFVDATPAPVRVNGQAVVWELTTPAFGQEDYVHLNLTTPTGISATVDETMYVWATTDAGAAGSDPPTPPDWSLPHDATWGYPQDVLCQSVSPGEDLRPDLWIRKDGPRYASPGDTVYYAVTVGNRGLSPAESVIVKDQLPEEMGDGDRILVTLPELLPGEEWQGTISAELAWGVAHGTVLENVAYVTGPAIAVDPEPANNTFVRETTTLAAHDPNMISVDPAGGVDRGQAVTYTLQCENTGEGTAYGVYAAVVLAQALDADSLSLAPGMSYEPGGRTITWDIGTLGAGENVEASFTVSVRSGARRARPIIEQAVVYFPSVPEETPTNIVVNVVSSTFSDIPWNHWAVLPIEQTYENGIVRGYDDGTYRPTVTVDRGQMAVYVARALAGGDANVPTGPAEPTFPDVPTDHWAYDYVEYAHAQEVVQGYDDGTYRPTATVDRGQMAVYIARALAGGDAGVPTGPAMPTFSDVTPDGDWGWCYPYVEYAVSEGVVGGYPDGTYRPEYEVTRDQMAVYVQRAFRLPM